MRKSKFSETQIVGILKGAESWAPVADLLRKYGVSKATFFKWPSKYRWASMSDVKRLRELEAENEKLKRMYADLALEDAAIKDVLNRSYKAVCEATNRRGASARLSARCSERVAWRGSRMAYYQPPVPASRRDAAVIGPDGRGDALSAVGLLKALRPPAGGRAALEPQPRASGVLRAAIECTLAYDASGAAADPSTAHGPAGAESNLGARFMTETLYDGRRIRLLTIIDEGNREGLEIVMGVSLPSRRVVRALNELVAVHGGRRRCGSTTGRSLRRSLSSTGAPSTAWRRTTSSPANPTRTRTSSASIGATGPRC